MATITFGTLELVSKLKSTRACLAYLPCYPVAQALRNTVRHLILIKAT